MSRVRRKDTKLELFVWKFVYKLGYCYRLQVKSFPGTSDLVCHKCKKAVFVYGCFWRRFNRACALTSWTRSKLEFWKPKPERNRERDLIRQKTA
ncbi:MAG: very short patch repair endonuclease [Candidatus Obscuribacterales bacterium]|nr:very short patch repair endonuclease [Candidatus Obscuribacterales bacterium]